MGTSTIGFVETVRTLGRIGDFPHTMRDLVGSFTEILVTEEVRDAAARLPPGVRTLDAIHVASAHRTPPGPPRSSKITDEMIRHIERRRDAYR